MFDPFLEVRALTFQYETFLFFAFWHQRMDCNTDKEFTCKDDVEDRENVIRKYNFAFLQ